MYKTGKNIRRLIMLLMAVIVMATMTANICYKVKAADGDGIEWSYDEATKTLKISGSGKMTDYSNWSYDVAPWSIYEKDIETVIISEGVTGIGDFAFRNCSSLSSISIPTSVTSIGRNAFSGCSSLRSISILDSVASIGILAFSGCSSLSNITVEDGNTVYDSRENCNAIIETGSNTLIAGCKSTIIPTSVTSIGFGAFSGCSRLSSISIPSGVTSIDYSAFSDCSSLSSITVEGGNKVYDSRENCNAIIETGSNTLIAGCKSTIIPSSVTTIGDNAFGGSGVSSISIPASVTSIGWNVFDGCSSLRSISIPDSVTSIGGYAFEYCNSLRSITIPSNVTSIDTYAFSGCSSLSSISIPDSVTSIDQGAFSGCSSLSSISIPTGVTSIGKYAFSGCSENLTIYGEANSYAQTYAEENSIAFKLISEKDPVQITDASLFMAENTREHILIGVVTSASEQTDIEYRWSAKDSSGTTKVIKEWTLNNEWLDWTPDSFGEYTLTAEARVAANPSSSKTVEEVVFFNPYIKGKCQVPYAMVAPGQPGYLIGVETYENPNQSYQYEMLILDCTLLAEGKPAWVYTTGKFTVTEGAAGWCVWQPQYGYYWTLFRVYDAEGNMIDQACYPFVNAY